MQHKYESFCASGSQKGLTSEFSIAAQKPQHSLKSCYPIISANSKTHHQQRLIYLVTVSYFCNHTIVRNFESDIYRAI